MKEKETDISGIKHKEKFEIENRLSKWKKDKKYHSKKVHFLCGPKILENKNTDFKTSCLSP